MAKNDNLKDFVTDLANAIREKKGTTDLINPQDFSMEIKNLPSGGDSMGFTAEMYDETILGPDNFRVIRINDGVTTVETGAFSAYTKVEELYVGANVSTFALSVIKPTNLKKIEVDESNTVFDSRENCNAIIQKKTLYKKTTLHLGCVSTIIPDSVESLGYSCCQYAGLVTIDIPELITSVADYSFAECTALTRVTFPSGLTTIRPYAFYKDTAMEVYDFRKCLQVPTLLNIIAFSSIPTTCKIVVPDALYDSWIAATNWSTYADRIVKSSEYTE